MMKKGKRNLSLTKKMIIPLFAILLMAVGYSAISTSFFLDGTFGIEQGLFDVRFTNVTVGGTDLTKDSVSEDGKKFTHVATNQNEVTYEVTNLSKDYDVEVNVICSITPEKVVFKNTFNNKDILLARTSRYGSAVMTLSITSTEVVTLTCSLDVVGLERTKPGDEIIKHGTIYGVKRSIDTNTTKWERIEDSIGLVANATKDGSAVQNDFDNIYPWSDIITYNYDDVTKKETAVYGDENFKFDGSNGQVLTRIPEFYYKREQKDGVEYQYISKYPQEGYTKSEAFSVGRYTMSWDDIKLHSSSGTWPTTGWDITILRNYARNLGENFGLLDWRYFLIQMLYLVEYADYNSQEVLGLGNVYHSNQAYYAVKSGGCDVLGMKSGTLKNDGYHSMIYRGMEDIYGNVFQYVDGINIKDNQAYINYNPSTYTVDTFDGDYQSIGYINGSDDGYITNLGYDVNYSLIAFPIAVGGNESSYLTDAYWKINGNGVLLAGGCFENNLAAGLWHFGVGSSSEVQWKSTGGRLLRYA